MADQYIVIAGSCPPLHSYPKGKGERRTGVKDNSAQPGRQLVRSLTETEKKNQAAEGIACRKPKMGDVFDEDFFMEGEIPDLMKRGFIEKYVPYKVTKADLELKKQVGKLGGGTIEVLANGPVIEALELKVGTEIHTNLKNFTKAAESIKK